jgi:hypothetical protein
MIYYIILCYVMLCLCYVMLCYVMLRYIILYYIILVYIVYCIHYFIILQFCNLMGHLRICGRSLTEKSLCGSYLYLCILVGYNKQ